MDITDNKFKYLEWKRPDEMHYTTMQWLSEMNFIQDEFRFLKNLLKEYSGPFLKSKSIYKIRTLSQGLEQLSPEFDKLYNRMNDHNNRLYRLLENIDEPREARIYKEEHKRLLQDFNDFSGQYQNLKQEIFGHVSEAIKKQHQKRLLN